MSICPNCGAQHLPGAVFCDECGAKLDAPQARPGAARTAQSAPTVAAGGKTCPHCAAPVPADATFCPNCHAAFTPPPPPPAVSPSPPPPVPSSGPGTCVNCGASLQPGSRFCDMCGAPVETPAAPPAPAPSAPPPPPPTQAAPSPHPQSIQSAPPPPPPPPTQARLVVQGTHTSLPFTPGKQSLILGREDPVSGVFPDIDLTDHGGDEGGVSRKHARIYQQGRDWYIEDLDSTNYTFVNQERVLPDDPQLLEDGAEVRLGRVRLVFHT